MPVQKSELGKTWSVVVRHVSSPEDGDLAKDQDLPV